MTKGDPIIDEIKAKIDLVDLISLDCDLDKRSSEPRGAHENKHQSESGNCLVVYPDTQKWHCYHKGCECGGDALDWIADRDGLDISKDFPEILRIAAEYAGVELPSAMQNRERQRVFECLTAAAEHFNSNMTNDMYHDIEARWGITRETADKFQIGMSKIDHSLEEHLAKQGFSFDEMQKSGLFSGELSLHTFFKGRYVFPYGVRGQVRYMIARASSKTPDNKYEKDKNGNIIKFKKLPTQKKKRYISKYVKNDVMFGSDSLWGIRGDFCIITEGVADAVVAIQAGFPCISPVTTRFRKQDQKPILQMVRKFAEVYVIMDSEENEAGLAGAYSTCKHLIDNGVDASIVELPRTVGVDKIDLADYLRDNSVESFRALLSLAYKPPEFFKPPAEQFLIISDTGKEKFSPIMFARWLTDKSGMYFITFMDTDEIFFYDSGIYHQHGGKKISGLLQDIMHGEHIGTYHVNEVLNHIRRETYVNRAVVDGEPYILNLKNCLYDIKTATALPHTPKHMSITQLPVAFDPNARCERFEQFVREILPNEEDQITIMEMFGHTMIKDYDIQKWFMFHGDGANGKTTLLRVLTALLGSKNVSAIKLQELERTFSTSYLYGKMANINADLSYNDVRHAGVLLQITGGDQITAQFKNKPLFSFVNHATVIYSANILPPFSVNTHAMRRRMVYLSFSQTFLKGDIDRKLGSKLTTPEALSGVLNYALQGAKNLIENEELFYRYGNEEVMRRYTRMSDSVATFLDECVEFTWDDDDVITKKELYNIYKNWWVNTRQASRLVNSNAFSKKLGSNPQMNEGRHDSGAGKTWKGIRVRYDVYDGEHQSLLPDTSDGSDAKNPIAGSTKTGSQNNEKNVKKAEATIGKNASEPSEVSAPPKVLLESMRNGIVILRYTYCLKEFDVVQLLMKGMPKIEGLTTELLTQMLDEHLDELKIVRLDDGTYKQKEE